MSLSLARTKHHDRGNKKKFRSRGATAAFNPLFSSFSRKGREEQTNPGVLGDGAAELLCLKAKLAPEQY